MTGPLQDNLKTAQSNAQAARTVSSRHWSDLLVLPKWNASWSTGILEHCFFETEEQMPARATPP